MAARYDIPSKRGNNDEPWRFRRKDSGGSPINLTGHEIVFRAVDDETDEEVLRKTTADGGIAFLDDDPTTGDFTVNRTVEESRLFPVGNRVTRYELEGRVDGKERTFLEGWIKSERGVNDDG